MEKYSITSVKQMTQRIKTARKNLAMSTQDLARLIKKSKRTIDSWEVNGELCCKMAVTDLVRLAAALKVEVEWLLTGELRSSEFKTSSVIIVPYMEFASSLSGGHPLDKKTIELNRRDIPMYNNLNHKDLIAVRLIGNHFMQATTGRMHVLVEKANNESIALTKGAYFLISVDDILVIASIAHNDENKEYILTNLGHEMAIGDKEPLGRVIATF